MADEATGVEAERAADEATGIVAERAADEAESAAEHEERGYVPAGDPTVKLPAFEEWHEGETESAMESPAFEVGQAADEAMEEVADVAVNVAVEAEKEEVADVAEQAMIEPAAAGVRIDEVGAVDEVAEVSAAAESSPVDETAGNVVSGEVSAAVVAAENAGGAENVGMETAADKLPAFEEWNNEEENSSSENQSAELGDVLKITPQEVDAHFQKIKQIMAAAAHKAELIKEKAKNTGLAQSPAVQRIKTWIERKFKK